LGKRTRVTKKGLKHDAFVETTAKGTKFIEEHLSKLLIGAAAVLVAVVVVFFVVRGQKAANREAQGLLAVATESLNQGLMAQASDQYRGVIEAYPGTRSAGAATCYLGSILFHQKQYDEALAQFDAYLNDYGSPGNLRVIALEGKAAVFEQRRDFQAASTLYEQLATERKAEPAAAARSLMAAARCQRAAQNWEAVKSLAGRVVADYPDTPSAGDARVALAEASALTTP